MRKWTLGILTLLLFLSLAVPALADDGGDQVVFLGDHVVIDSGEEVDGNVVVFGGSVEVRESGRVRGDLVAIGGEAAVNGRIDGSLVVVGGSLRLLPDATVHEDLVTFGAESSLAEGARVLGQRIEGLRWRVPETWTWPWLSEPWAWRGVRTQPVSLFSGLAGSLVRWVGRTLAWMALGLVILLLLPKQTALVEHTVSTVPLPSAGVGLLTFVVLLLLVPLLVVICIGIPVAVILAIAFLAALVLGRVAIGAFVGRRLFLALRAEPTQPLLEVAVGIGLVELVTSVPCLGGLLAGAISLAGLGAVVLTRYGTMAYQPWGERDELPEAVPESGLDVPTTENDQQD